VADEVSEEATCASEAQIFKFPISIFWETFACLDPIRDGDPMIHMNLNPDQYQKGWLFAQVCENFDYLKCPIEQRCYFISFMGYVTRWSNK
jgi:hypothetical protein